MKINSKKVKQILGKHILADGFDPIIDLNKSQGSWIVDHRDGKKYLDMFSMYASGAVGYNHPYILGNSERIKIASYNKTTLSDIYNIYYGEFVEILSKTAMPKYLPYAFFIDGGALAVENALKVAFDWKVRKNLIKNKNDKGYKIIHFKEAFHGRTGYTLSLTNTDPIKTKYFPKFDWPRVENPHVNFPLTEQTVSDVEKREKIAVIFGIFRKI